MNGGSPFRNGPRRNCRFARDDDGLFGDGIFAAAEAVLRWCLDNPAFWAASFIVIPDPSNSDSFHGIIAVHSGRRSAHRDVVHRASIATHPMGRYDPPGGPGAFSAGYVARRLWYMYHGATRALPAEKIAPVKWVAVTGIWYNWFIKTRLVSVVSFCWPITLRLEHFHKLACSPNGPRLYPHLRESPMGKGWWKSFSN